MAGLAFREPLGGRGIRSELLLLSCPAPLPPSCCPSPLPHHARHHLRCSGPPLLPRCGGVLHRISVPSPATAAVHGAQPSRAAAPPLPLCAHHPLVSALAFHQRSGLLAVGGGGGVASAQAALLLAKRPPAALPFELPDLSLWHLSDASPYAMLLFATAAAPPPLAGLRWLPHPTALWALLAARFYGHKLPHALAFSPQGAPRSLRDLPELAEISQNSRRSPRTWRQRVPRDPPWRSPCTLLAHRRSLSYVPFAIPQGIASPS